MGTYKTKIVENIICSKLDGELDATLASEWVEKLEEQESVSSKTLHRFHDVRDINAVHLSFDDLWSIAQRRIGSYQLSEATISVFWVSTPLNYGISRMYQALTDGTPFRIEVMYKIDEIAELLDIEQSVIEGVTY